MYFSIPPALLHGRQAATESYYEALDFAHDEAHDAGKLVIEIQGGRAQINWPWNARGYDGLNVAGDDAGLQQRLDRWMQRAEWQDILSVACAASRLRAPPAHLTSPRLPHAAPT